MPVDNVTQIYNVFSLVFSALVVISIIHSIVLMRVCLFVIDRVFPDRGRRDQ